MSPGFEGLPGMEATVLAEQALLGALLLRPRHLVVTVNWLEARHFYLPHHAALYSTMRKLAADGHPALADRHSSDQGLDWLKRATALATQQAPGLTPSHAHTLVNICPQPDHAAAYGRMVLAGHTRRSIAEHAQRLADTTRSTRGSRLQAATVSAQADTLASALDELAEHWHAHPGATNRGGSPPPLRKLPPNAQRHADEQAFLSAVTTRPHELRDIRAYLTPEDFASPLHQQLYRCLSALHHRGEPIDPVTVVWEAQHRGVLADATPETVLTTCARSGNDPAYWAAQLLDHALISTAATSAQHIEHAAADSTITPHRLITISRRALGDITAIRLRRHQAHHGPPTPPARPSRPSARHSSTHPTPGASRHHTPSGPSPSSPHLPAPVSAPTAHIR
ncbi:DnaB-like helicase N-terminal domain-containing protein [Streptomyces sp. NPDC008001]|uniref:DnaB-like helicase N-terminal domain-containing protein n=1 Tax=Streptomyces sp. NPDC008001 TaxID=3364804 RepID=UPI0036EDB830